MSLSSRTIVCVMIYNINLSCIRHFDLLVLFFRIHATFTPSTYITIPFSHAKQI